MGVKVTFDPVEHQIVVTQAPTSGIVSLDFAVDVYSDGKEDWLSDTALARHEFPIRAVGGDPLPGSKILDATYFIKAPWKVLPYDANHELIISGNVYREDGASISTARSGRTVTVTLSTTFSAGATSSGGGADADAIWAHNKALTVGKFLGLK